MPNETRKWLWHILLLQTGDRAFAGDDDDDDDEPAVVRRPTAAAPAMRPSMAANGAAAGGKAGGGGGGKKDAAARQAEWRQTKLQEEEQVCVQLPVCIRRYICTHLHV
jgi:hypothetical protein